MNYLAHAWFSPGGAPVLVGNMISDFIKGRLQYTYAPAIQVGIRLHRAIDAFTDHHEATREAKKIFRPHYRLYAGAFADVAYDHFLANDTRYFADAAALEAFAQSTYQTLQQYAPQLPPVFQHMLPAMTKQNWLYHYHQRWGIGKSFGGVVHRSQHLTDSAEAFRLFEQHYHSLQQCYDQFIPELHHMVHHWPVPTDLQQQLPDA